METEVVTESVKDIKTAVLELKQQIANYVLEQKALRRDNPHWSNALQQDKMGNRYEIRRRHLTIAYLLGVPYKVLEKKCHEHDDISNRASFVASCVTYTMGTNLVGRDYIDLHKNVLAWMKA